MNINDFSSRKTNAPSIGYVAAPQANIYFDGILIDECYDIQYTYREAKEPIYGYLSTHFDAVLRGTVIITGALTINYKHDQYLTKALAKAADPINKGLTKRIRSQSLKSFQSEYNQVLAAYGEALKKQAVLKNRLMEVSKTLARKMEEADAQSAADDNVIAALTGDVELEIEDYKSKLSLLEIASIENEYKNYCLADTNNKRVNIKITPIQEEIDQEKSNAKKYEMKENSILISNLEAKIKILNDSKVNLNTLYSEDSNFAGYRDLQFKLINAKIETSQALNDPFPKEDLTKLTNEKESLEKQLTELNIDGARENIKSAKEEINNLTVTDVELQDELVSGDSWMSRSENKYTTRAEDMQRFTIEFNYNGSPHKRIVGCELLGHSHVLTQSGMPVKEIFSFIGRRLE